MEYDSAFTGKEVSSHAVTWMNLYDSTVSHGRVDT